MEWTLRDLIERESRYFTVAEIAENCGVSRQHLYALMNGEKVAKPKTIQRIAEGLELTYGTVAKALRRSQEG